MKGSVDSWTTMPLVSPKPGRAEIAHTLASFGTQ